MIIDLPKIKVSYFKHKKKVSGSSANDAYICQLNEKGKQKLKLKDNHPIFFKKMERIARQEEAAFSALYRLDIGDSAATTLIAKDKGRNVGVASIGLKQFIEYWKLYDKSQVQKYSKKHDVENIAQQVIEFDKDGKPTRIKYLKGLASVLMSSWLYAEDDFHCGNFGLARNVNDELVWARLDFGMSFSSITNTEGRTFREQAFNFERVSLRDLIDFPKLTDAKPFYWPTELGTYNYTFNFIGAYKKNTYHAFDEKLFSALKNDPVFLAEKHAFLLKQFLTDIDLKKSLIKANIDAPKGARLATTIESRVEKLRWTALADPRFRHYVSQLSQIELKALIDELAENHQQVLGLDPIETKHTCQRLFVELTKNIEDIEQTPQVEQDFDSIQAIQESIFTEENLLIRYQAQYDSLSTDSPSYEYDKASMELRLHHQRSKVNHEYARYLGTVKDNTSLLSKRLENLQAIIVRRSVLEPINQMLLQSNSKTIPTQAFLINLRDNWLIPNLEFDGEKADHLFQSDVLLRIRNIEQLLKDLTELEDKDPFSVIFENYCGLVTKKTDHAQVKDFLKNIEHQLVRLKYNKVIFSDKLNTFSLIEPQDSLIDDHTFFNLAICSQIVQQAKGDLLSEFFTQEYSQGKMLTEVENTDFIGDLRRLDELMTEYFDKTFFLNYTNGKLSQRVSYSFKRDLERMSDVFERYHLKFNAVDPHALDKLSFEDKKHLVQELSFVLSRAALNIERAELQDKLDLEEVSDISFDIERQKHQSLMKQLTDANRQLSRAMARPHYHEQDGISQVAQAGLLAARACRTPTPETAAQCMQHVEKLINSGVTRLATKVAFAVAVVSLVIFASSLIVAFGPLSIPILSGLTQLGLAATAVSSGLTFFATTTYGVNRYIKDKDKARRYMEEFSKTTYEGVKEFDLDQELSDSDSPIPDKSSPKI